MKMPVHSGMKAKVLTRGYPTFQLFLKPTVHRAIAQGFHLNSCQSVSSPSGPTVVVTVWDA